MSIWDTQLKKIVVILVSVVTFGVCGFMFIEGWSFLDSLYMTVVTMSTVGYKEVHTLSPIGRVFAIVLIVVGVGSFLYILSSTVEYVVAGHLAGALGRRKMKKRIDALKDHYIICGIGRVGEHVARQLEMEGVEFVVIDIDPEKSKLCDEDDRGYAYIIGDASKNEILKEAGIERAKGLVSATNSDAANVYVTLSAKSLKSDLLVVARGGDVEAEKKLLMAGADRVASPYAMGGNRLASLLLKPTVIEFLDVVMHSSDVELYMEEIRVGKDSLLLEKTILDVTARCTGGVNILAVRKKGEKRMARHSSETVIGPGDKLVALGTREQLKELEGLS